MKEEKTNNRKPTRACRIPSGEASTTPVEKAVAVVADWFGFSETETLRVENECLDLWKILEQVKWQVWEASREEEEEASLEEKSWAKKEGAVTDPCIAVKIGIPVLVGGQSREEVDWVQL